MHSGDPPLGHWPSGHMARLRAAATLARLPDARLQRRLDEIENEFIDLDERGYDSGDESEWTRRAALGAERAAVRFELENRHALAAIPDGTDDGPRPPDAPAGEDDAMVARLAHALGCDTAATDPIAAARAACRRRAVWRGRVRTAARWGLRLYVGLSAIGIAAALAGGGLGALAGCM